MGTVDSTAEEIPVDDHPVVDHEPSPTNLAVVRRERRSEVIRPLDTTALVESFAAYQNLLPQLLTEADYQDAEAGKKFVKKSGWRKIATAFDLDVVLIDEEVERDADGQILRAKTTARATSPSGRVMDGDGYCTIDEFTGKRAKNPKLENDLRGTAATRAKNRAISDLVGMGDVSAEEVSAAGAPAAPAGPVFGAPVDEARGPEVMAALRALIALDTEPGEDHALPELKEMAKKAARGIVQATAVNDQAGYMPAIVANTIVMLAQARAQRYGQMYPPQADQPPPAPEQQGAMDTGDRPAPSSVPAPPMTHQPAQDIRALREAGCVCESPLEATSSPLTSANPTCPISGHGDPQTGD